MVWPDGASSTSVGCDGVERTLRRIGRPCGKSCGLRDQTLHSGVHAAICHTASSFKASSQQRVVSHASLAISTDFDYYHSNLWPTTSMKYICLSNPPETDFVGLRRRRRTPKLWHRGIRHPKTQSCRNLHRLCTPTAFYRPRKHQPNQLLDICAYCMGFRQFRQPPNAIYAK